MAGRRGSIYRPLSAPTVAELDITPTHTSWIMLPGTSQGRSSYPLSAEPSPTFFPLPLIFHARLDLIAMEMHM